MYDRQDNTFFAETKLDVGTDIMVKYLKKAMNDYGITSETQFLLDYEAGPTGYGLCRGLKKHGFDCVIMAPTTIKKAFITFVASIVRNEIPKGTRKLDSKLRNTYTVPVTVKELETIEASVNTERTYYRRYVLTAKQKKLLSLFGLSATDIDESISKFNRNRK